MAESVEANPYVGPRPFEVKDTDRFFGRSDEVSELLSLVTAYPVVLLYAQSGAGKTSLLNAGVVPLLVEESFEVLPTARVRGFEPENINLREIPNIYVFNTLIRWAEDRMQPKSLLSTSIADFLKVREHLTDKQGLELPRVVIFDQFEELFTSYPDRWKEREDFFHQVAEALEADSLLRVLFVIREDYLANLDSYVDCLPEQLRTRYRLERLRAEAACQAVEGPLQDTERSFAKGVASSLVRQLLNIRVKNAAGELIEVAGEYVEPVQLQVVCQSLWQNLPSDVTVITSEHLQEFGDVEEAIGNFYERAIEIAKRETGISEDDLRNWFKDKLITPAGTRGTVFQGSDQTEGIPNLVVEKLETQHIIRAEMRAGARWYELTHDRLIEPIWKSNEVWFEHQRAEEQQRRAERQASIVWRLCGLTVSIVLVCLFIVLWMCFKKPPPPEYVQWNLALTEYLDWVRALRIDLGLPWGNQREKQWTKDPYLNIIVENVKKASYPYDIAHDNNVQEQDLNEIENEEDFRKYRIRATRTIAALKATEIIKFFFDIKSNPNSFSLYDPNSPTDRKEFQKWPILVETQQTANKFKGLGWQELAKSLEDLIEQVRPGLDNKNIAENVDKILEVDRKLDDIKSRWTNIEKNQKILDSTGDPILARFLNYIQLKLVSANLDNLDRELEQMGNLAGELTKFIEDNWRKVDKNTFLSDHGNESGESLKDDTFTDRLVLIKDYLYLDPDPRKELFELVRHIEGNIELARLSNPIEASLSAENLEKLKQDIREIEEIPGIEKYRFDITDAVNFVKVKLTELEEKVLVASLKKVDEDDLTALESPEMYLAWKAQKVPSVGVSEEINNKWLTLKDNLLDKYPLSSVEKNLEKYAELRRKIYDTIRNITKLNEELQTELPEKLKAEIKEVDWNNKLKQLYAQERKEAVTLIVENIPLQDDIPDINDPSFKQFSRTQFSKFQQLQIDLSGILKAFNEIEDNLNLCYLLDHKLPESNQTVRLLWSKWKDSDILKDVRIQEILSRLTKRIINLEEIEKSDDRDMLGNIATNPNSQTAAVYTAWTRLDKLSNPPWPTETNEFDIERSIQENLKRKFAEIGVARKEELLKKLAEIALKHEMVFKKASIGRFRKTIEQNYAQDKILSDITSFVPTQITSQNTLEELEAIENLVNKLADFVSQEDWQTDKFRQDLFRAESKVYKYYSSVSSNNLESTVMDWLKEVEDYKIVKDPREDYQWDDKITVIKQLIEKELLRKQGGGLKQNLVSTITGIKKLFENVLGGEQTSSLKQSIQKLKQEYDNFIKTEQKINAMRKIPAIEKNKNKIDAIICNRLWENLLNHEAAVRSIYKPEYCNRIELENGQIIFASNYLSSKFEPIFDIFNKMPVALADGWEDIRRAMLDNRKEWLNFFYTIDLNDTKNVGWPKYVRSKKEPSVVLRFIPAGPGNPEPFYMATHEVNNAQYRLFLEKTRARSLARLSSWSLFVENRSSKYLIRFDPDYKPSRIKWDNSMKTFIIAKADENIPVVYVTYYGALSYAEWLGGQLPTASQHKYACKAGTNSLRPWANDQEIADYAHVRAREWLIARDAYNSKLKSGSLTGTIEPPVGAVKPEGFVPYKTKLEESVPDEVVHNNPTTYNSAWPVASAASPNNWALYDMIGNVWEWCHASSQSVICGGSCLSPPEYILELEYKYIYNYNETACDVGFRIIVPAI